MRTTSTSKLTKDLKYNTYLRRYYSHKVAHWPVWGIQLMALRSPIC